MGLTEYECPSCGGVMNFDAGSQMLLCPYCDTKIKVSDYKAPRQEEQDKDAKADSNEWLSEGTEWKPGETDGMVVYSCQSCGGEIVASETEGSLTCPFCSNNVVVKEKFAGDLRPDYVIPFKKSKQDAMDSYAGYVKGKLLLPRVFFAQNHIDKIRGIYIPYWLYDAKIDADYRFEATKVRTWSDSDYNYTETSFYEVDRSGHEEFSHVPHDASKEMPDDLMESIEPFNFSEAVPFNSGYLAGFLANRYDVDVEETKTHIVNRMENTVENDIRNTVTGYSSVTPITRNKQVRSLSHKYALYPVWLLNTSWNGNNYLFAMNGQSGKFVGNLPVSKGRAAVLYILSALGFTLISIIICLIIIS
ncbi:hypothetical protein [Butyrivibrio sp. INlla16]|uniref:hypothetical protein n=1 Tax=Butyrivibrio sp. INlla16 TaxID=1520807 RepID=UPI00088F6818|nr:hypothetical protein [Butyrivibrio sp. INlla16]SDB59618.1 DNA-directed RNA polymerase, subunit RPC12/RpoP, contains C4-type Zn-finger [Butyrivibrio sp. INlla16]